MEPKSNLPQITDSLPSADGGVLKNSAVEMISCAKCGELFKPIRKTRRYCSNNCWLKSDEKRNRIREAFRAGKYDKSMKKTSERMKKSNPMKNQEVRKRQIKTIKESYASGKYVPFMSTVEGRKRIGEIARKRGLSMDNPMRKPEVWKRVLATALTHPNQFEGRIIEFLDNHKLPFKFTGNASFWIGPCKSGKHRNPDFINQGMKKALLAHGRYWHQDLKKVEEEVADYREKGWECFLIWDSDKLDQEMLLKLESFAGRK